jgi:general L-amino acid transport system substrate-binding protein
VFSVKLYMFLSLFVSLTSTAGTLENVKKNGKIKCGVSTGLAGFSSPDSNGTWRGLDVDFCRALSAAIFGSADKVQFVSLNAQQRFTALQSGEIDVLSRNTTFNLTRDTAVGINFAPVTFYDGQGFMVRKKDGVKSARDLDGASVCTQQGTTNELNMADYFRTNKMKFKPVVFESNEEVNQAFFKGRCDALTSDKSGLASERTKLKNPNDYLILPEVISKEPLAPAVRHGDDQWLDVVKWVIYSVVEAEELGLSSANIDQFSKTTNPAIRKFIGLSEGNGRSLGLSEKWAYNVVKRVGNYEEIFNRHVGKDSRLKLDRGLNQLWKNGGLMYAPPVR